MAGSIQKRGENTWRLFVYVGRDGEGKQIKKTKTIETSAKSEKAARKEAEKELAKFAAEIETGIHIGATKFTLKSFVERWLKEYAEKQLAPRTLSRYKEILELRIIPALGHLRIEQIKPLHLVEFYNNLTEAGIRLDGKYSALPPFLEQLAKVDLMELAAKSGTDKRTLAGILKGKSVSRDVAASVSKALNVKLEEVFASVGESKTLSNTTILHHHRLLSTIFTQAVQWQVIATNPASRVKPPKTKKKQAACYDEQQTAALLEALEKEPPENLKYKAIIHLAIGTGLRRGELMGLEWCDIDFTNNSLTVRQASQYVPGQGVITKDPKNETSKRVVSIPLPVAALLLEYKDFLTKEEERLEDAWKGTQRLFTTWDGAPMHPDTISNWFPKFLVRHNLPHLNFHGLRHTSATLLIGQGVHAKTISNRLGHSNISTTMDIYGHALKSADKEAADKLEGIFTKKYEKSEAENGEQLVNKYSEIDPNAPNYSQLIN